MPAPTTADEVLGEIKRLADELGAAPAVTDFEERARVSTRPVYRIFGSWPEAVRRAGFEPKSAKHHGLDDPETFRELHVERGMTVGEIADHAGVSDTTALEWRRRHGYDAQHPRRTDHRARDEGWLRRAAHDDLTDDEIADAAGCSPATVRNWRQEYGVPSGAEFAVELCVRLPWWFVGDDKPSWLVAKQKRARDTTDGETDSEPRPAAPGTLAAKLEAADPADLGLGGGR